MSLPKICLNMIVKNESKIIIRLLDSVANLIDFYCICDTGSTDNTKELIKDYFENKEIPGKLIEEPFQNFEYNRTLALKECDTLDADYILLLDADMVFSLKIDPMLFKRQLMSNDCFFIFQGNEKMYYKNTRIVRNKSGIDYKGVTHEYVNIPHHLTQNILPREQVFINDIGDGGSKHNKFSRDVKLLKDGIKNEPDNVRYMFYLANSLKDNAATERDIVHCKVRELKSIIENLNEITSTNISQKGIVKNIEILVNNLEQNVNDKAWNLVNESIDCYKKRINMGGFWEEIWYSYYNIGNLYLELDDPEKAIFNYYQGFVLYPQRVENLYKIIKYYREHGQNTQAVHYYILAKKAIQQHTGRDYLFIERDIYDYKLDYEMSILGYYHNPEMYELDKLSMYIMYDQNVENNILTNVLSNYKFYCNSLKSRDNGIWKKNKLHDAFSKIGDSLNISSDFVKSSPTFQRNPNNNEQIISIVRYVNYYINEEGGYVQRNNIETINVMALLILDKDTQEWTIEKEKIIGYNTSNDNLYVGLEDMRIFFFNDELYYNANRGLDYSNVKIEHGKLDMIGFQTENDVLLESPNKSKVEKNWVMFNHADSIHMVYNWYPLTIGTTYNNKFLTKKVVDTPPIFRYFRGSTNGVLVDDEIWFLVHAVSYEDRRFYYHAMVALDKNTLEIKYCTKLFSFNKNVVEYCLGMNYFPEFESFMFTFSILDKEIDTVSVDKQWFIDNKI